MRRNERVQVSKPQAKAVTRNVVTARKIAPAKTAVRGTILARQVKAAAPAQRVQVGQCGACDSSSSSSSNQGNSNNNGQCQPIDFSGCDCTSIDLGCLDSTSNIDPNTGLNQDIETALGNAQDIADCLSSTCGTPVTPDQIQVTDIPAVDQPASVNGTVSQRLRIFTVTDACGQSATLVRTVTFQETGVVNGVRPGPVATCPADRTVPCGTPTSQIRFDAPFFTNGCGDCNFDVTPPLNQPFFDPNIDQTGTDAAGNQTFTRTFTATDACGTQTQCTQTITVLCHALPPTGCTADFWNSPAGQALLADRTGPLAQELIALGIPLNACTRLSDIFPADIVNLLGNPTLDQILNGESGDCAELVRQFFVAILNIASEIAFPNIFPLPFQFPAGSTDAQSLLLLVEQTIRQELNTPGNQQLCLTLSQELEDANQTVCEPHVSVTGCDLAFFSSQTGLALFNNVNNQLVQNMPPNVRFTTQTQINTLLNLNNSPPNVLNGITVQDILTGNLTVTNCPALVPLLQQSLVAFLNIVAQPQLQFPFGMVGFPATVNDLTTLRNALRNQINTILGDPSSTNCANAQAFATNLQNANAALCAQVPPGPGLKKLAQPKLLRRGVQRVNTRAAIRPQVQRVVKAAPQQAKRCFNPK